MTGEKGSVALYDCVLDHKARHTDKTTRKMAKTTIPKFSFLGFVINKLILIYSENIYLMKSKSNKLL